MSWPMPTGQWNPGIAQMPIADPGMGNYTPEQWAALQQQQYAQWMQWQQQYSQWQTQYGEKYAEQMQMQAMNAGVAMPPPLPLGNAAPVPAPPPPDKPPPPPPPHENDQPLYDQDSRQQSLSTAQQRNASSDSQNLPGNNKQWPSSSPAQPQPPSVVDTEALKKLAEEERLFDIQFAKWEEEIEKWRRENVNHPDKQAYKVYEDRFEDCRKQLLDRRQLMNQKRARLQGTGTTTPTGNAPQPVKPPQAPNTVAPKPIQPISSTGNASVNPHQTQSKNSYQKPPQHYPRQDMQQNEYSSPSSFGGGNNISVSMQQDYSDYNNAGPGGQQFDYNKRSGQDRQRYEKNKGSPQGGQGYDYNTGSAQGGKGYDYNKGSAQGGQGYDYNKGSDQGGQGYDYNKSSDQDGQGYDYNDDSGHGQYDELNYPPQKEENFFSVGGPNKGIPGLDLVPDDKGQKKSSVEVIDITEDKKSKVSDLSTISKGINNILGDEKIMNILSMVKGQTQKNLQNQMQTPPQNQYAPNLQNQMQTPLQNQYAPNLQNQMQTPLQNQYAPNLQNKMQTPPQNQYAPPNQAKPISAPNQNSQQVQNQNAYYGEAPRNQYNNQPPDYNNQNNQQYGNSPNIQFNRQNNQQYGNPPNIQYNRQGPAPQMSQPNMAYPPPNMINNNNRQGGQDQYYDGNMNTQGNRGMAQAPPLVNTAIAPLPERQTWAEEEPLFTPSIIVEYDHKQLRLKARDFIEPVHTFDYNHISKESENKKKDFEKEVDEELFTRKPARDFEDERSSSFGREMRDPPRDFLRRPPRDNLREPWANQGFARNEERRPDGNFDERQWPKNNFDERRLSEETHDDRRRPDIGERRRPDEISDRRRPDDFERRRPDNFGDRRRHDDVGERRRPDDRAEESRRNDRDRNSRRDDSYRERDRESRRDRDRDTRDRSRIDRKDDRGSSYRSRSIEKDSRKRAISIESEKSDQSSVKKSKDSVVSNSPLDTKSNNHVVMIDDLLEPPGRDMRPEKIVVIMRGPPGSGKSYLAKLIKEREAYHGGSARIMSIDDYFMQEQEIEEKDPVTGKTVKKSSMKYEYDASSEQTYVDSLKRAFKRTLTDGYFPFLIYDAVNEHLKTYADMWNYARQNGFQAYICTMDLDAQLCHQRNIHNRSLEDIQIICSRFFPTPAHHINLDATNLLQSAAIEEVTMEDAEDDVVLINDDEEPEVETSFTSKWEKMDDASQLARLDGISKPLRSQPSMEDYLQLDDWKPTTAKPGKKTVRWADIEEGRKQEKARAIGFVVGQTDWNRMTDPTMGSSALTQTKYIERVRRN